MTHLSEHTYFQTLPSNILHIKESELHGDEKFIVPETESVLK